MVKAEGDGANGRLRRSPHRTVLGHAIASYWDAQLGLRYDTEGPDRLGRVRHSGSCAVLVRSSTPQPTSATKAGRPLRVEAEYELPITNASCCSRVAKSVIRQKDEANGMGVVA